ncbi:MAG: RNA methyltransferase [Lachnospiraceae bacterium]|nr:RNA methyltransferase [Lachnospiraceae bacterium]
MRQIDIVRVTDLAEPELDVFARLREPQLYHYYEPAPGLFLAEGERVAMRALDAGFMPVSVLADERGIDGRFGEVLSRCAENGGGAGTDAEECTLPVYAASFAVIKELTGYSLTGGFLCAMRRKSLPSLEEVCGNAKRIAVLERVTNPTNVGAIIRSAAALSVDAVLLTNDSCDPLCRRAIRVSMGTIFQIPWTVIPCDWPDAGLSLLREMGFRTVALALREDAHLLGEPGLTFGGKAALLFGAEGDGLMPETVAESDLVVKIPMRPGVDSLNVAAASAVAFWEFMK